MCRSWAACGWQQLRIFNPAEGSRRATRRVLDSKQNGWCRVDCRGRVGWASSAYLAGAAPVIAHVEPYYTEPYYGYYDYYGPFAYGFGPEYALGGGFADGVAHGQFHHFHHMVVGGVPGRFGHPGNHVAISGFHAHFGSRAPISPYTALLWRHASALRHISEAGRISRADHPLAADHGSALGHTLAAPRRPAAIAAEEA